MSDSDYDSNDSNESKSIDLSVSEFFRGKTVFLTGATGFLGKSIIEKLLYSCDVKQIYCLIREKRNKVASERLRDLMDDQIFKFRLKSEHIESKLTAIAGDISLPDLGISECDRSTLINTVNIIIHSAATVKFDEPLE